MIFKKRSNFFIGIASSNESQANASEACRLTHIIHLQNSERKSPMLKEPKLFLIGITIFLLFILALAKEGIDEIVVSLEKRVCIDE